MYIKIIYFINFNTKELGSARSRSVRDSDLNKIGSVNQDCPGLPTDDPGKSPAGSRTRGQPCFRAPGSARWQHDASLLHRANIRQITFNHRSRTTIRLSNSLSNIVGLPHASAIQLLSSIHFLSFRPASATILRACHIHSVSVIGRVSSRHAFSKGQC